MGMIWVLLYAVGMIVAYEIARDRMNCSCSCFMWKCQESMLSL